MTEIEEGNKTIAKWFGEQTSPVHFKIPEFGHNKTGFFGWSDEGASTVYQDVFMDYELRFHKDWSWLMPVINKAYTIHYSHEWGQIKWKELTDAMLSGDINKCFGLVVELIKWLSSLTIYKTV